MDIASDTGALTFNGALTLESFEFLTEPATRAPQYGGAGQHRTANNGASLKPPGLPNERQDREGEGRSLGIPAFVVITSDDVKVVVTGRQIRILDATLGAGIDPFLLEAVQSGLKPDFIRRGKAEPGITNIKAMISRRNLQNGFSSGARFGRPRHWNF